MDKSSIDVGLRIKKIRKKEGKTLEEFGELFSPPASKSIVSRWENGKSIPNVKRLQRLSEIANCSVDEILYGTLEENILMLMYRCLNYINVDYKYLTDILKVEGYSASEIYYMKNFILFFKEDGFDIPPTEDLRPHEDGFTERYREWKKGTLNSKGFSKKGIEYILKASESRAKGLGVRTNDHVHLMEIIAEESQRHFDGQIYTNVGLKNTVLAELDKLEYKIDDFVTVYNNKTGKSIRLNNDVDYSYYKSIKDFILQVRDDFVDLYGDEEEEDI